MGTPTQIGEFTLGVQRQGLIFRNFPNDFRLVRLALTHEEIDGLIASGNRANDRLGRRREFFHLLFDGGQVVGREGAIIGKVVIKSVFDHRAYGDLGSRVKRLDGLGQQMRRGVTNDVQTFRILAGDNGQSGIVFNDVRGVNQMTVDSSGEGRPGQTGPNAGGYLHDRHRNRERPAGAIRQCNYGHRASILTHWAPIRRATKKAPRGCFMEFW